MAFNGTPDPMARNNEMLQNQNTVKASEGGGQSRPGARRVDMSMGAFIACLVAVLLVTILMIGAINIIRTTNSRRVNIITTPSPFENYAQQSGGDDSNRNHNEPESSGLPFFSDDTQSESAFSLIGRAMSSVVCIDVMAQSGHSSMNKSSGSGVIVSEDGYIVTCAHVIDGADKIYVYMDDGLSCEAAVVGRDSLGDIAVLKVDETELPYASFGDSSALRVGENVFAVGNALGQLSNTYTRGVVSGLERTVKLKSKEARLIHTDAAVNNGNSGGGLFRASDGALMGIVDSVSIGGEYDCLGFAIPSTIVSDIVKDLINFGYVLGRPYLGVETESVTLSGFGFFTNYHTYPKITALKEDGPAEKAGLEVGDVILSVGGTSVSDADALDARIGAFAAGDTVVLSVMRADETLDIEVKLEERTQPDE